MRKLVSIFLSLATLFMLASSTHAQVTPPYTANNGNSQVYNKPHRTYSMYYWGNFPNRSVSMKWKTSLPSGSATLIQNAFNLWGVLPGVPDYYSTQQVTSQGFHIEFVDNNSCSSPSAYACFRVTNWDTDNVRKNRQWFTAQIDFQTYNQHGNTFRQIVLNHEIGHALGLGDRYLSNGGCDSTPLTAMGAWNCPNHHDNPTQHDSDNLRNFYRFCDQLYSWCGEPKPKSIAVQANGRFVTRWDNQAWNHHTLVVFYFRSTSGWGGPYQSHSINNSTINNVGFWHNGIVYNNSGHQDDYVIKVDEGNARNKFGQGNHVYACAIPWAPNSDPNVGYVGQYRCTNAIQIP